MFKIPRVNVIESDQGFSVEVVGRTGLRYKAHGMVVTIDSEVLAGPSALVVYTDSIQHWDVPNEGILIDNGVRREIIENIREAFRFRGLEILIQ